MQFNTLVMLKSGRPISHFTTSDWYWLISKDLSPTDVVIHDIFSGPNHIRERHRFESMNSSSHYPRQCWARYSELSICRVHFSSYNSRKTPHSSLVRAMYRVLFVSANITVVSLQLVCCVYYRIIYNRDISRVHIICLNMVLLGHNELITDIFNAPHCNAVQHIVRTNSKHADQLSIREMLLIDLFVH